MLQIVCKLEDDLKVVLLLGHTMYIVYIFSNYNLELIILYYWILVPTYFIHRIPLFTHTDSTDSTNKQNCCIYLHI